MENVEDLTCDYCGVVLGKVLWSYACDGDERVVCAGCYEESPSHASRKSLPKLYASV